MKRSARASIYIAVLVFAIPLLAQEPAHVRAKPRVSGPSLLTQDLGEMVVEAALNTHRWDYYGFDCSHFVQAIFSAVGLPFEYANSIKLYNGADEFRRVFHPQPGDLIVWQGHVGIVVDPEEHSFYSMLRSGLRLSTYDSRYWKARGRTRFVRYAAPPAARLRAVKMARLQSASR
jgi:cell wall-associated NlpC family hydrolase